MSTQHCVLSGGIASSLKRVLDQNSILAFRAGGKQSDWATHQFLDPADIFDGLRRQICPGAGIGGLLLPSFDGLVDRLYSGLRPLARRRMGDFLSGQSTPQADPPRVEALEKI